ncbi:MAG: EthD domain-containing protein [Xenococcaceae cyanobacterium MO_188.B32]|nr:EthD domain-containing protein [Xenococcaceae cyanobacterium MO_188.B32]
MSNQIQSFGLLTKKRDLSDEQFHYHWREVHGPLGLRTLPVVKRYVQNHRIPGEIPGFRPAPYEGVSETWFDKLEDALNLPQSKEYLEGLYLDEPNLIEGNTGFMMTRERVVLAGPKIDQDTPLLKALFILKRKQGMSLKDFEEGWQKIYDPINPKMNLVRYVQCYILPETYEFSPFDGVAEMWWSDRETFEKSWALPEVQSELDNWRSLLDEEASVALLIEEARLLWT